MKCLVSACATLALALGTAGCPIYSGGQGDYLVCDAAQCFDCPDPQYSSSCVPYACASDYDCPVGYGCSADSVCVALPGGSRAPGTPCPAHGCSAGSSACDVGQGPSSCSQAQDAGAGSSDSGDFDGAQPGPIGQDAASEGEAPGAQEAGAPSTPEASTPLDGAATDGSKLDAAPFDGSADVRQSPACNADCDCSEPGSLCIDGQCTAPGLLCSGGLQCAVTGDSCVASRCVPQCTTAMPCPAGYACDFSSNLCAVNPTPCSGGNKCVGGAVCVEGHCLAPCGAGEEAGAAGTCPQGQACVNGGCLPDERAIAPSSDAGPGSCTCSSSGHG